MHRAAVIPLAIALTASIHVTAALPGDPVRRASAAPDPANVATTNTTTAPTPGHPPGVVPVSSSTLVGGAPWRSPRDPKQPMERRGPTRGPRIASDAKALPKLKLIGAVERVGGPAAIIEIAGETILVHGGDEITIGRGPDAVQVRILRGETHGVWIDAGKLGEHVVR